MFIRWAITSNALTGFLNQRISRLIRWYRISSALRVADRELTLSAIQTCVRGKLKGKEEELFRSIQGFFTDHHRFVLKMLLSTIATLEAQIEALDLQIRGAMKEHDALLDRMKQAPGIADVASREILAEIGSALDSFPKDTALVAWCGLCRV